MRGQLRLHHNGPNITGRTILHCNICMAALRSKRWRSGQPLVCLIHRSNAPPPAELRVSGDPLLLPGLPDRTAALLLPAVVQFFRKPAAPPPAAGFFVSCTFTFSDQASKLTASSSRLLAASGYSRDAMRGLVDRESIFESHLSGIVHQQALLLHCVCGQSAEFIFRNANL